MKNIIFLCCIFSLIVFIIAATLNITENLGIQLFVSIVLGVLGFALYTVTVLYTS